MFNITFSHVYMMNITFNNTYLVNITLINMITAAKTPNECCSNTKYE